jgi:hypothetical protein
VAVLRRRRERSAVEGAFARAGAGVGTMPKVAAEVAQAGVPTTPHALDTDEARAGRGAVGRLSADAVGKVAVRDGKVAQRPVVGRQPEQRVPVLAGEGGRRVGRAGVGVAGAGRRAEAEVAAEIAQAGIPATPLSLDTKAGGGRGSGGG